MVSCLTTRVSISALLRVAAGVIVAVLSSSDAVPQEPRAAPDTIIMLRPLFIDTAAIRSGEAAPIRVRRGRTMGIGMTPEMIEADGMIAEGHYREAINILYPLWLKSAGSGADDPLASSLKRAYRAAKDYDGMFAVLERQLEARPEDGILLSELAEACFAVKADDSAKTVLKRLIAVDASDPQRHRLVAETYVRAGKTNEGLETYRKARITLDDSAAFASELAGLLEARREYTAAVEEYFRWLNVKPESERSVQRAITNLIKIPEAAPQITTALQKIVTAFPEHEYAHRLYGDLLAESGRIDSAFAEYRRADQRAKAPGTHRLFGIERCLEAERFQAARDQAVAFLADYPEHRENTRVHLALAHAELSLGHAVVAVDMLKELAGQFPPTGERSRIEFEIGEIYRAHTEQMDSARAYYGRVVDGPGRSPEKAQALLRLGDIDVYFGDLIEADSAYQRAAGENPLPPQKEEIAFRRAEVLFLSGSYDVCGEQLDQLVKQFPRGMFVNDALELKVILDENRDELNWSLNRYAAGVLAWKERRYDSAVTVFTVLASDTANTLADEAQFAIGDVRVGSEDYAEGAEAYRKLIAHFPGSFFVPRAWAQLGELYSGPLTDPAQARHAYQVLVTDFKDSPLVEEARRRLQQLPAP